MTRYFSSAILTATVISALFLYSCSSQTADKKEPDTAKKETLAFDLPHAEKSESKSKEPAKLNLESIPDVIAEIDNQPVKKDEYVRILSTIEKDIASAGQALNQDRVDQLKSSILRNIINTRVFLHQAKKEKITVEPSKVEERIALIKKNFPSDEAFEKMLKERGASLDSISKSLLNSMIIQKLIDKNVLSKIIIADGEAKKYYDQNQLQFESKEAVRASHILVKVAKGAKAEEKEKAFKKAEMLRQKLGEGADFAQMAKDESDDPGSARKGGDLGFFGRGRMVPAFEKAAFGTEPGKISELVETQFGYHILKVTEKKPAGMALFKDVKTKIEAQLKRQESDKRVKAYIEKLKKEMNVKTLI